MKKAFSLVELVFVMVILGILASFIITSFSAKKQDADIATIKIQIAAIRAGIRDYATSQIISGKTEVSYRPKDIYNFGSYIWETEPSKNESIYPLSLEGRFETKELFSLVLPKGHHIKGANNENEKGWSRFNDKGGTTYPGRYFVRFGNKSVQFDYCSEITNYISSYNICRSGNQPDINLIGKLYCAGTKSDCNILGEEKIK
ncbi:type II secretion system protein [Campylobacter fetus]|uniref:type II secretion system protein n=1 Tax=Campylobacter fetus TaxID=196 RepID=UPI00100034EF|nr:type II secretion system protein [Campylobacter fetus]RUT51241.1 hypothetical protein BWK67_01590 [Campylobacter fetus]RUT51968.1 hypothetical protein BWK51_01590 [Campylobacter fetus]